MNEIKSFLSKYFDAKLLKFLLVGGLNTLVGAGIMFLLYNLLHAGYWFSSAMNYVCGSVLSYFLNKHFTFQSKKKSWKEIASFAVCVLVCYGVAYGVAKPIAAAIFSSSSSQVLKDNAAMVVGMGMYTGLNYFGQRLFVFKNEASQK